MMSVDLGTYQVEVQEENEINLSIVGESLCLLYFAIQCLKSYLSPCKSQTSLETQTAKKVCKYTFKTFRRYRKSSDWAAY